MKITKSKSTLKLKLQVVISESNSPIPETAIYDVSAFLWVLTVAKKGTLSKFICAAYGNIAESCMSMIECRANMWRYRTGKSGVSSVKLCSLPPTNDAFVENISRCHLEVATWKAAFKSPPTIDPTSHGWELDHQGILLPRTVPTGTLSAPADVLKLIHCNYNRLGV
ncbi:hypothetical protein LSH36_10g12017 [Paralvinella palmiformis]|uniref:Uncharacterized protein n=1 Tax=Paralvinella palmiformis TaxID=53620 RepID=A0AAD9KFB1_9ANNE|nr:hypothetical protein LSH36_10g12017 [Paralvinella palmiformis]